MDLPTFPTAFRARMLLKDARSLKEAAWITRGFSSPQQGLRVLIEKVRRLDGRIDLPINPNPQT
jgi:hypothetical protein